MDLGLNNKLAVVTAASEGLGYGCAERLAREGASVVICSRSADKLEKAVKTLSAWSDRIFAYPCDLADLQSLERFIKTVGDRHGVPEILVISTNHPPTKPFSQATPEEWQLGHDLLIRPAVTLCRAWLPGMKDRGYGRITAVGSIFGREHEESSVIQSTYRTGLAGFVKCIAREYAPYNISANIICPGYFDTPLVRNLARQYAESLNKTTEAVLDDWKKASPADRYGTLEEIGALTALLSSSLGGFISGSAVTIDGATTRST